jgi:hypothetical protein
MSLIASDALLVMASLLVQRMRACALMLFRQLLLPSRFLDLSLFWWRHWLWIRLALA